MNWFGMELTKINPFFSTTKYDKTIIDVYNGEVRNWFFCFSSDKLYKSKKFFLSYTTNQMDSH